ncbi:trehalose-6-phosphate synthase [Nilaparvata lugens]|uniref:trehalose-6-phosphate synthase n=1 Tax=Nilaparvata lugens TaxID=108931 RepID=UPI00193DC2DC|nr:trehalose-6-phosphate synthase [Nilaparvata lugens]
MGSNQNLSDNLNENIIIVAIRLPVGFERNVENELVKIETVDGLVCCMKQLIVEKNGYWIGRTEDLDCNESGSLEHEVNPDEYNRQIHWSSIPPARLVSVTIDKSVYDVFYNLCCKGSFWPLLHSMPDRASFNREHWKVYCSVNEAFANKTVEVLERLAGDEDTRPICIWIHDYHMLMVSSFIRAAANEKNFNIKIGFFLHSTFPPWDVFKILPWADEVLQSLLESDLIAFNIQAYCLNFVDCCQRCLGCRVDRDKLLVENGSRSVCVRAMPIGIPFKEVEELLKTLPPNGSNEIKEIVCVDRLDFIKGILHRLYSYETFLQKYPEFHGKVFLLQITIPCRSDLDVFKSLKVEIDQQVGRINGLFATTKWTPIQYIYGVVDQIVLFKNLRDASVAMITPLRDGMNMSAKLFVACQMNSPPGVLLLSKFAGTADTMEEALQCNPYEKEGVADSLYRALTMPNDEREARMIALRKREMQNDSVSWSRSFLDAIGSTVKREGSPLYNLDMRPLEINDFNDYLPKYIFKSEKLALITEYDGTLVPSNPSPPHSSGIPASTYEILQRLVERPNMNICVISGRTAQNLKDIIGIEKLIYAGNHGLEILYPDGSRFSYPMPDEFKDTCSVLLQSLQELTCRESAWVENQGAIVTLHLTPIPKPLRPDLIRKARGLIEKVGFHARICDEVIEATPPVAWNASQAVICIMRTVFGIDWSERVGMILVGDSLSDEEAFEKLRGVAATFSVVSSVRSKTSAERRLYSIESVHTLLDWIDNYLMRKQNGSGYNGFF